MRWYFLIFLIILPVVTAQTSFFNEDYSPGETVQFEINFDLEIVNDITSSQVSVDGVRTNINLFKIEKNHYLGYFYLPEDSGLGSYSLKISNVRYRENGILKIKGFENNFGVQRGDAIGIFPGISSYKEGEGIFRKIRVSNLGESSVSFNLPKNNIFTPTVNLLQIPGRSMKTFYILINPDGILETGIELYNFDGYVIPFYLVKSLCVPSWDCVSHGDCQSDNKRYCNAVVDLEDCGEIYSGDFSEFGDLNCVFCSPDWSCNEWGECISGLQNRDCRDLNRCDFSCDSSECDEERSCSVIEDEICVPSWSCGEWGECESLLGKPSGKGEQTRECNDLNNCGVICDGEGCETEKECVVIEEVIGCDRDGVCESGEDELNCPEDCVIEEEVKENKTEERFDISFFTDKDKPEVTVNSLVNPELGEKEDLVGNLFIKNTGKSEMTNIKFRLTGNLGEIVELGVTRKSSLDVGEVLSQKITVNENKNPEQDEYQGDLVFSSDQFEERFSMIFVIVKEKEERPKGITEREILFTDEVLALDEDEDLIPDELEDIKAQLPEKELPYKLIVSILVIILVILIYFMAKRPVRKDVKFKDFISKAEKK